MKKLFGLLERVGISKMVNCCGKENDEMRKTISQ